MRSPRRPRTGRRLGPPTILPGRAGTGTGAPSWAPWLALLLGPLARVRTRLTIAFLAVSLLVPLVGLVAVQEQYAASLRAAQIEARHVAEPVAHTIANTAELTTGAIGQLYHDPERLQDYLDDLQRDLHRHIEVRSEEHTSELQSRPHLVCRLLLEKKKKITFLDANIKLNNDNDKRK